LAADGARFQPVAVEAVGAAFVGAATEPKSIGQTYDLCGPELLTLAEMVDEICGTMGRKRLKIRLPLAFSRRQAAFFEFAFPRLLRRPAPLNRDQLIMLQEDNTGDPRPANSLFGLSPVTFRAGIAKYLTGG
jgi:NADH dehydrogenase